MNVCPNCHGTNFARSIDAKSCPACDGTGLIFGTKCVSCAGAGYLVVDITLICERCDAEKLRGATPFATLKLVTANAY
jgi:DnaJ-class molecular chaperone